MKIMEFRAEERPREKLMEKGREALTTAELLAILIRTGTRKKNAWEIARELLEEGDGKLDNLMGMSLWRLRKIPGIGPAKAVTIAAALELGRRAAEERVENGAVINDPKQIFDMMLPRLRGLDHEQCWVLFLDKSLRCLSKEKMTSGGGSSTTFDPQQILRLALDRQATAIVLVHNHPCGDCTPSKADIEQTRRIQLAVKPLNIMLIDHVIISSDGFFSFTEESCFDRDGEKKF